MVTHQLQVERRTGKVRQSETDVLPLCYATNYVTGKEEESVGNESVPTQLAQCWFPGLAISNTEIFLNKIYGRNFIKQHSETDMV